MGKQVRYRVRNWPQYNRSLIDRGNITVWFDDDVVRSWYCSDPQKQRGIPRKYSDVAIECALTLRCLLKMPLRTTQGFIEGIIALLNIDIDCPNYTTVSRRSSDLPAFINTYQNGEDLHLVVDSSGLKVFGEGEWKVRCHGYEKRRTWRKIHIGVDSSSHEIVACALTTNDVHDSNMLESLIDPDESIVAVYGDGAYDSKKCYEAIEDCGAKAVIPPRHGACLDFNSKSKGVKARNRAVQEVWRYGRKGWKEKSVYHKRSLAETGVYRLKTIFGDKLRSRKFESQAIELFTCVNILNYMTSLGMPRSVKFEV